MAMEVRYGHTRYGQPSNSVNKIFIKDPNKGQHAVDSLEVQ